MELIQRLNILKDTNQISEETYNKIIGLIESLKEDRDIELTEDNGAMFITHLCSALTRIKNGEKVNNIDNIIFEEIKNDINYHKSVEITDFIEKHTGKFPKEERDFIEMHICTLLNK